MTNVSKHKLPEKELAQLFKQFESVIVNLNQDLVSPFLSELLGHEEQIMLAKRLYAIAMFIENNSSYKVWTLLHISPTTANKIRLNYECGRYRHIEKALKANKNDYRKFWIALETILQAGMPPRGRGRWKSVLSNK